MEALLPIASLPVCSRVAVDSALVHEVLNRSLSLLARVSITSAEFARNIFNICEELLGLKVLSCTVSVRDSRASYFILDCRVMIVMV